MTPGLLVALGVTLAASVTDIRERRIPNKLILVGLVIAAAIAVTSGQWLDALAGSLLGMAILALPRLVSRDAVGLGDVKLVGVVGMGVGVTGVAVVTGLAVAVATATIVFLWLGRRTLHRRRLPFAPFLAVGASGALAINAWAALA